MIVDDPAAITELAPPALQRFVRVDQRHGYVAIWLEPTEGDECLGVLIGTGNDVRLALLDAEANLVEVAKQLDHLMRTA